MTAASGAYKRVIIKKEVERGLLPTATGAQLLRRVEAFNNLSKDLYQSEEQRSDFQVVDERHGVRRVAATLNAELSPGSYSTLVGSLLKRDFTTLTALTGLSLTIAAGVAPAWVLNRATGSWLTDGVKVGRVCRLTAGTFNAANLNKNLLVTAVTALGLTVVSVNGSDLAVQGTAVAGATLAKGWARHRTGVIGQPPAEAGELYCTPDRAEVSPYVREHSQIVETSLEAWLAGWRAALAKKAGEATHG